MRLTRHIRPTEAIATGAVTPPDLGGKLSPSAPARGAVWGVPSAGGETPLKSPRVLRTSSQDSRGYCFEKICVIMMFEREVIWL